MSDSASPSISMFHVSCRNGTHTPRRDAAPRQRAHVLLVAAVLAAPLAAQETRVTAADLAPLSRNDDEVMRTVGDVELRASDVFRILDLAAPSISADVMREMVLTTVARLEAQRERIDVPVSELEEGIEQAMAEQTARFAVEVEAAISLEEFLEAQHGLTPQAYRKEVRRMVLASLLLERVVRLHQLRLPRDELQIMLLEDAKTAEQVRELLEQGASFSVLAKRHSIHPSGPEGGFMPILPADVPVPLVEGRQGLEAGEWIGPAPITVEGKDYWRLVRLVERYPAVESAWSEVRDEIEVDLKRRPVQADELAVFEAHMLDRYRVERPPRSP